MNEYEVTLRTADGERVLTIIAATAALARDEAEEAHDDEVTTVRFVRALSFSCRTRDGRT